MKPKSCFLVAAPFSGARVLADYLVKNYDYNSGASNLPSLLDPSMSSYEDKWISYMNQFIIKQIPGMDQILVADSWKHPFPSHYTIQNSLCTETTCFDRIVQSFSRRPFLIKDPNVSRMLPLWAKGLDVRNGDTEIIYIIRHPSDFVLSLCAILNGTGVKPTQEYGLKLWLSYVDAMIRSYTTMPQSVVEHAWWFTLPQLCTTKGRDMLHKCLGLSDSSKWPFNVCRIRYSSSNTFDSKGCRDAWRDMLQFTLETEYRVAVLD